MASNYTENFGLCQWETTDQVLRTEFNEDNAKVDAILKDLSTQTETLTERIKSLGNCQFYYTSYIGTGTNGQDYPTSLNFPVTPYLAIIVHQYADGSSGGPCGFLPLKGCLITNQGACTTTWSIDGKTASWYTRLGTPTAQLNMKDVTYQVYILAEAS